MSYMAAKYGEHIREMRAAFGFTQIEVAKKAGIALNSLRRYESSERQPTLETIEKIASAFNMRIAEFLWYDPKLKRSYFWIYDLETKLEQAGYSLGMAEENKRLWINYPDCTLEVTTKELEALHESTNSYMRFKLDELKNELTKDSKSTHKGIDNHENE